MKWVLRLRRRRVLRKTLRKLNELELEVALGGLFGEKNQDKRDLVALVRDYCNHELEKL